MIGKHCKLSKIFLIIIVINLGHTKGDMMKQCQIFCAMLYVCTVYPYTKLNPVVDDTIFQLQMVTSPQEQQRKRPKAHTTVIIYMAADNDLRSFAARNIKQMTAIGSNQNLHIAVHLDIRITGNKKITRRYYIEQNKILHMNANDPNTQIMDSGQEETLISACQWAITSFPADEYVLIFWNHGTGILDPIHGRMISPTELFNYNPTINMLELDRSTSILGAIDTSRKGQESNDVILLLDQDNDEDWHIITEEIIPSDDDPRGICWDDSSGNYLTNQKLDSALTTIRQNYLNNGKFAIIGFDACLMSMLEVGSLIKKHAYIMVGSQEVELGTGWNYQKVFEPFLKKSLDRTEFALHIARVYEDTYNKITNDYTQSAVSLDDIASLEDNVDQVATYLTKAMQLEKNNSVHNAIRASKNKLLCTHFDEPSYIDLYHFYANLEQNLKHFSFKEGGTAQEIMDNLKSLLNRGKNIIQKIVIANVCGKNLSQAHGISIYLPDNRMHSSYPKSPFGKTNHWTQFIKTYITG